MLYVRNVSEPSRLKKNRKEEEIVPRGTIEPKTKKTRKKKGVKTNE